MKDNSAHSERATAQREPGHRRAIQKPEDDLLRGSIMPNLTVTSRQSRADRDKVIQKLTKLKRSSVGIQAAEAIKSLIITGVLKPGDTLPSERELSLTLGISRPSLREAIRVLNAMNVLEPRHGGGTYVTSLEPHLLASPIDFLLTIAPSELLSLFEVRQVLEVGAAQLAAKRITKPQLIELNRLTENGEKALAFPSTFLDIDVEIHAKIIEATGNAIYHSLYDSIAKLSKEGRRYTAQFLTIRRQAHEDHVSIVSALQEGDGEAAAMAMKLHLANLQMVVQKQSKRMVSHETGTY